MKIFYFIKHVKEKYLPANTLRTRFTDGIFWILLGTILRQGSGFLGGIIVARIIGVDDFGKFAVIQSTVLMLINLGQFGIGLSATKNIASFKNNNVLKTGKIIGFIYYFIFSITFAIGFVIIFFSSFISELIVPGIKVSNEFRLASAWIMFELISFVNIKVLIGLEAFKSYSSINIVQSLLLVPVMIFGAYYAKLNGIISAMGIVSIISSASGWVILKKKCDRLGIKIIFKKVWSEKKILNMALMVWLSSIAMNATNWIVGIFLARQSNGIIEFAIFNAANKYRNILAFITLAMFQVAVPVLANIKANGKRKKFAIAILSISAGCISFSAMGSIGLYLFSEPLMIYYGNEFANGAVVLKMISFVCIVSSAWTIISAGMWAVEKYRQMLMLDILRGAILIGISLTGYANTAKGLSEAYFYSYIIGLIPLTIMMLFCISKPWKVDKLSYQG